MRDDETRQLMKLARRLATDGHGELAQFLRDSIDDARRFRWLAEEAEPSCSTIYLATDSKTQSMHPQDVRARIDTDIANVQAARIREFTTRT